MWRAAKKAKRIWADRCLSWRDESAVGTASEEATAEAGREVQSFESFYETEQGPLYGTLCLVTGDRAEAEELMQDAFLKVWEHWDRVASLDDPRGYLYRTAFNLFRNRIRQAARAARRMVSAGPPADAFAAVDERQELAASLRACSPRQRAALVLLDLFDFTSGEAGRVLGVKAATVRALASQARQAIRASMGRRSRP